MKQKQKQAVMHATVDLHISHVNMILPRHRFHQVKLMLRQQPQATIISVSQNDNMNYCKDPGDLAIIAEEGSPIGACA